MLSVNTNYGAMIALQNLNQTGAELAGVQNRINTGLKIAGPKDNGAVWAIAQSMRMDVQALNAVTQSLMSKTLTGTTLAGSMRAGQPLHPATGHHAHVRLPRWM